MHTVAIIVSAGKGKRLKGKIPKQYVKANGKPLIYYTITAFDSSPDVDGIILVSEGDRIKYCWRIVKKFNLKKVIDIVKGGPTRAHSVFNGLKAVPKGVKIVVIHDGVRPLVKMGLIKKVIDNAKRYGAAISAVPEKNTIKEVVKGLVKRTLIRKDLVSVQTPQAFKYNIIMDCYNRFKDRLDTVTDDSSIVEMAGYTPKVVMGDYRNIKITTKDDLRNVRGPASHISSNIRVGVGYDIHRLVKGRRLVLGGVEIPYRYGLIGHSDADVLLHAITDAMLGAIGERDIGWHFPNSDPRYKDIASSYFLLMAKDLLKKKGYKIQNIDSIIIAQEPRLQPYYSKMVSKLTNWLGVNVTVKFTTPEEVGPLGHRRAMAGIAIVCVRDD